MIIRAPTRTKTNSFKGQQMGFKFPSTESLPKVTLDEYDLNNHHLLNDNANSNNKRIDNEDAVSQILSDYTSTSNTNTNSGNSSNGYYSFANISDNTTASPKLFLGSTGYGSQGVSSTESSKSSDNPSRSLESNKTPLLEPAKRHHNSQNGSSPRSTSPMEVIPESNAFSSMSTVFQSIPTADNHSFDITSSRSSSISLKTTRTTNLRKTQPPQLKRTPTVTRIRSTRRNGNLQSTPVEAKPVSHLKRSKAVRCKGGLLRFFILLGMKMKKQLSKLICSIKSKMFAGKSKTNFATSKTNKNRTKNNLSRSSSKDGLTTSHLKRTQKYVNNLQRSMSYKSLQPVLMSKANRSTILEHKGKKEDPEMIAASKKHVTRNPTTSLRRTNSSIRRAASVITTPAANPVGSASDNSRIEHGKHISTARSSSPGDHNGSKSGLVRSAGSKSLSLIARQPSIVVKNKVIPLSMHHYSIEEEDEDDDEYIISTNSMHPLSPVESVKSDDDNADSYVDAAEDFEANYTTPFKSSNEAEDLTHKFSQYLRAVVAQRIMLRLQIAKHQETGTNTSYLDLIESIIREYETDSSSHNLINGKLSLPTTDTSGQDTDDEEDADAEQHNDEASIKNFKFSIQSPFGTRSKHGDSMISLSTKDVRRSLTLPIGIKV